MVPEELSRSRLESALDGAALVYFDVRLHETALVIAKEVITKLSCFYFIFVHFNRI